MTVIEFSIEDRLYGIDAADVIGVVPLPPLRRLDLAPAWVAGLLPRLQRLVPVVDLSMLHVGRACRRAFSTRVILVRYLHEGTHDHALGLAAEHVVDVADLDEASLEPPGVALPDAPWLGRLGRDEAGRLLQLVSVDRLLPADVRELMFRDEA